MAGGVEVATEAILRAWKKVDYGEVPLLFTPRGPGSSHLDGQVNKAVQAANDRFDPHDGTGYHVAAESTWPAAMGRPAYLVVLRDTGYEPAVRDWLDTFAGHLSAAGLSGKVAPAPKPDARVLEMIADIPRPLLASFLAYTVVDRAPNRFVPFGWNVADAVTARIAASVEADAFEGAVCFLRARRRLYNTTPAAAAAALRRTLPGDCVANVKYLRPARPRAAHAHFFCNGQSMRLRWDPQRSWPEHLAGCVEVMKAVPEGTDLAFAQYTDAPMGSWSHLESVAPRWPAATETDFRYHPHLAALFVPDARGAMVLTDAHLDRAHDLSGWSVTPLGHGRHLVQHPDPAAWYAHPVPDPEVLAAARADFGDMILTPDAIERNPAPKPGP